MRPSGRGVAMMAPFSNEREEILPAGFPGSALRFLRDGLRRFRGKRRFYHSLSAKNLAIFVAVFLASLAPMVVSYWRDAQENRIDILGARLFLIAEYGATALQVGDFSPLTNRSKTGSPEYRRLVAKLKKIQTDFGVDNVVLVRRGSNRKFSIIADGNGQFFVTRPVLLHDRFPETFRVATESWEKGVPVRTGLIGFGTFEYLQIYSPIKSRGSVVAMLLINKFAEDVDQAIRLKTGRLVLFSTLLALLGVVGFWFFSRRMLSPLVGLKNAALKLSQGDLEVDVPAINRKDEVSDLNDSFRYMVGELRQSRKKLEQYSSQLERSLAKVQLMETLEMNLFKFVPREVSRALRSDPRALEKGKIEKDVTVLFLDVQGSTKLTESMEPRSIDRLIEVYFSKFLDPIYEFQGDITETAGDGLMIIFQEKSQTLHATNAINAAVAIQRITAEIQGGLGAGEERIMINIGINSGQALVGFTKYEAVSGTRFTFTASGRTTIVAARLADLATEGSILVSTETRTRLRGPEGVVKNKIRFSSLGERRLKNIIRLETVFRVEGEAGDSEVSPDGKKGAPTAV